MSNFPLVRYRATDMWIPDTDIDGVDAIESVISDISNMEFNSGFMQNMANAVQTNLPANVISSIIAGYSLMSSKMFSHSTQGTHTVYVLWKTASLRIYLDDTLLDLDENNYGETYSEQPHNINYNLVNDQLKINLNCNATLLGKTVMLNLTLVYLPEVVYIAATNKRVTGWYITPRWLGWAQDTYIYLYNYYAIDTEVTEDFEDATYIRGLSLSVTDSGFPDSIVIGTPGSARAPSKMAYIENGNDVGYYHAAFKISGLRNVGTISFKLYTNGCGGVSHDGTPAIGTLKVGIADGGTDYILRNTHTYTLEDDDYAIKAGIRVDREITIDLSEFSDKTFNLIFQMTCPPKNASGGRDNPVSNSYIGIDDLTIKRNKVDVVGLYQDGQRALLFENALGIYGGIENLRLEINKAFIDWRIIKYEIYAKISDTDVLVGDVDVDGTGWTLDTNILKKDVNLLEEDDATYHNTLASNYNLPNDSRVDNQRHIYSEIAHKGRVYFVNGDYKVYQSHILGNLAIQADSFPYDEDTGFGYFIIDNSKLNLALANSPTNDMVIITNSGLYIYYIQSSGTYAVKQLRMNSGSITISSIKSLSTSINGQPTTDGLFWADNNGIYLYIGGIQPPENLITATHQKYWEAISAAHKASAVTLYNPVRKEYWLCYPTDTGYETLIYELPYKKFRKTTLYFIESIGINDSGYAVYRNDTSYIYTLSPNTVKMSGSITTHYNVCKNEPEIFFKILQELYMEFGASLTAQNILMDIYLDDVYIGGFNFNTTYRYDKWLSAVGLRFNRIKLVVTFATAGIIRIKEFGLSYSEDNAEPLGMRPV